jgi:hypothetical protein
VRLENPNDGVAVPGGNGVQEKRGGGFAVNALLEFSPIGETIFSRDDALGVAQTKGRGAKSVVVRVVELWVPPSNAIKGVGRGIAELLEQFTRFAFGNIEVGLLRQPA